MALNATISINVPALPETGIWFANSQAWSNYWASTPAEVTFDIATAAFSSATYNTGLQPAVINIDNVNYVLVTKEMFDSLRSLTEALQTSYANFRTELKNAGLITNA